MARDSGVPPLGDEPVRIALYDPSWPARFEQERIVLVSILQPWLRGEIEHVGSTAVPGLSAKPVIDMMVGVADLASSHAARLPLETIGYKYAPYRTDVMHWFCKPTFAHRTHHLHLIPHASRLWVERLAFRDYLRAHPETAEEYALLKDALAVRFRQDRERYTEEKGPFVAEVLLRALGPGS